MSKQDDHSGHEDFGWHYHRRRTDGPGLAHGSPGQGNNQGNHQQNYNQRQGDSPQGNSQQQGNNQQHGDNQQQGNNQQGQQGKDGKGEEHKPMSPRKKFWLIVIAIIVAIIVICASVAYWLYARQYETTDDAFIDGHVSQVAPQASGRIQSLLVDDNQQVEPGQLLAEIDPRDYQERLDQAVAQQAQAVAQVALQNANIDQAVANVRVTEADLFQANQDLKRYKAVNPKAITQQQLDNAIATQRSAQAKLDANIEAVKAAKAQEGTAEASVQQADADVSNAKLQLSYCKIISPVSGKVTRRTVEIGNVVAVGTPLLAVVSNELWVTANYKETQLDLMRVGQPVQIEIDAFPDAVLHGHVDSFAKGTGTVFSTLPAENATGNYVKVVQRVPVKIVFDDPKERDKYPIAPGLSVDPRVTVR